LQEKGKKKKGDSLIRWRMGGVVRMVIGVSLELMVRVALLLPGGKKKKGEKDLLKFLPRTLAEVLVP